MGAFKSFRFCLFIYATNCISFLFNFILWETFSLTIFRLLIATEEFSGEY